MGVELMMIKHSKIESLGPIYNGIVTKIIYVTLTHNSRRSFGFKALFLMKGSSTS